MDFHLDPPLDPFFRLPRLGSFSPHDRGHAGGVVGDTPSSSSVDGDPEVRSRSKPTIGVHVHALEIG